MISYCNTTLTHFSYREHIYILILKSGSNERKKASHSSTNFSKIRSYPEDGENIAFHKCQQQQYLQELVKFFAFWHISNEIDSQTKHPLKHSFNFRRCYSNSCSTLVFDVCVCVCVHVRVSVCAWHGAVQNNHTSVFVQQKIFFLYYIINIHATEILI